MQPENFLQVLKVAPILIYFFNEYITRALAVQRAGDTGQVDPMRLCLQGTRSLAKQPEKTITSITHLFPNDFVVVSLC